jgi:two-component system sensor histidine kinase and response regulator WspE
MSSHQPDDLSSRSMLELFRAEAETQSTILTNGLLELERGLATQNAYAALMRAAHSLKGAARIVNFHLAVRVAHSLEDCFVAAQQAGLPLRQAQMDALFAGVDLLSQLAKRTEANPAEWETDTTGEIEQFLRLVSDLFKPPAQPDLFSPSAQATSAVIGPPGPSRAPRPSDAGVIESGARRQQKPASAVAAYVPPLQRHKPEFPLTQISFNRPNPLALEPPEQWSDPKAQAVALRKTESMERVVRLTAENLNRLLGLASESLVESRWLRPFADSLQRLKRHQGEIVRQLETLRQVLAHEGVPERARDCLSDLFQQAAASQLLLADRMQELDLFDRRSAQLSQRLYLEALRTRMRPFNDGVRRFPRMVRDLARSLGKEVKLEILGENTQVDRDILERLETPLAHLLRNAVDHGCETADERRRAGKSPECSLSLEARHSAGVLLVTVSDDGAGVNLERVREAIAAKGIASPAAARRLTEPELLEFLFRPGFTLKETVTEISGRGFGLDVVQSMVKSVRGAIRLGNQAGRGLRVQLQLPLTLSVLRALLVEISGEPYAIPLGHISRTLKVAPSSIEAIGGLPHFRFGGQPVTLLAAHQVLDCGHPRPSGADLAVVIVGDRNVLYGLVVDRFLGERELVVQPLDSRLGHVKDISAAAMMEDGSPALIIDVEDMMRSIEALASKGQLAKVHHKTFGLPPTAAKRVLAVDDSLTVRELQRKLLTSRGYAVDVAVDGVEAWNAVCSAHYDLVITDIDMPRMDGIELAAKIKKGPHLRSVPVMLLSYKDREEDRSRGLDAGADCYLTKGSFHDETLLQAVVDLIGGPDA